MHYEQPAGKKYAGGRNITYSSAMSRLFPRVPEINLQAQHKRKKCSTSLFKKNFKVGF